MLKWLRTTFSLWYLLACVCSLSAQSSSQAPARPDLSQEAFIFEQISTKVTFENDGTSERETSVRARIQSEAGVQRFGLLTFSYQAALEDLEIPYVRVRKPDGATVLTPADGVQDMASQITREAPLYSDLREKHVAVKGLGVGDVVEYSSVWHLNKPLAPGQFWYAYNFMRDGIVLQEELAISVPSERKVTVKSSVVKPVLSESGKYRVYTWTTSNLEQKPKGDESKAAVQRARGRLPAAELELSSFQSWDEVGRWYGDLQQERVKPTPEIQAKAAELTKGATDDNAKLHAIYSYVSTQFRYIGIDFGIGRYQPHSAAEVLSNQYGDCKDKHTLLAALLAAAGIRAYPALISASHQLDPEVPSPGQFDHMISVVSQGNDFLWLDTTPEVAPFGYLLTPLRDKPALVIAEGKVAALVNTPADAPLRSTQSFHIEAKLDDSGRLQGKVQRSLQGDDGEVLLRSAFRSVPLPQWKDLVQQISYMSGFAGTVSDVTASSPENTSVPFTFSYQYDRKDYPDWENHRVSPPLPPLQLPEVKDEDKRTPEPIWLGAPGETRLDAILELPRGYIPQLPPPIDLKQDFAEYHALYTLKNGALSAIRTFIVKQREVPVSDLAEYKSFVKAVNDDRDRYVLTSSGPGASARQAITSVQNAIMALPAPKDPEAVRLTMEAAEDAQGHNFPGAIAALKAALDRDAKYVRGWLMLAGIYQADRQFDSAQDAYRKAITADPKQPLSYKMLAFALMDARRYEQAVKAWREYMQVAPDDGDGPANLGAALVQLKRYSEAASVFDLAIRLGQDTSHLEISLGSAYARAGDPAKSLMAFQKALQLEPGDVTENGIAYELAEANMNLLQALQYAEKAVRSVEEETATIEAASVNNADLECMRDLHADWDTLGWVHFQLGNLEQAEKYLNAAWTLSQDPVEGDHLGQVYEKEHKPAAAIHTYALTLARLGSMQETYDKLVRLIGSPAKADAAINEARGELSRIRSVHLERIAQGSASADLFIVFSPGEKVEDVKFISGSEKLRSADRALKLAKFNVLFPDDNPDTRLVRRGLLACSEITGCEFVLLTPDLVRSAE